MISRCGSLLPSASADARSSDDVIEFEGKVASNASNQVECGVVLTPDTQYAWKVRWWEDSSGGGGGGGSGGGGGGGGERPSSYSAPALLHTGLFARADWHGAIPIAISPPAAPQAAAANYSCTRAGACRMISTQARKSIYPLSNRESVLENNGKRFSLRSPCDHCKRAPSVFSRGGSLRPSSYADGRSPDAVIAF